MNKTAWQALHRADATIDFQLDPGDKLALVAGQIEHRISDIIRFTDLAQRDLATELGVSAKG